MFQGRLTSFQRFPTCECSFRHRIRPREEPSRKEEKRLCKEAQETTVQELVRHKPGLSAFVHISAEQRWRRRFGGRVLVEVVSGKQPRNWLILTESSGPASCLQVHPACGMSGQLPSQLKRDGESTASASSVPEPLPTCTKFLLSRSGGQSGGAQEIEWQRGDGGTNQGRGPQVKRNCSGEESVPTSPTGRQAACGRAGRWSQPSGNPALTDALSGIVGLRFCSEKAVGTETSTASQEELCFTQKSVT